jgi:hypothetical protein
LEVMERADFKCEKYGCEHPQDETNPLNVHHKYYDEENRWLEPWEYPRGSLQCLCEKHHREVHGLGDKNLHADEIEDENDILLDSETFKHVKYLDPQTLKKIKDSEFLYLNLESLEELNYDQAKILTDCDIDSDYIDLSALKSVKIEVLQLLSNNFEQIDLEGITEIDFEFAEALSCGEKISNISLGIKEISPGIASQFASRNIEIELNSLKYLDVVTASILGNLNGSFDALTNLETDVAEVLIQNISDKDLSFCGLTEISPELANILSHFKGGEQENGALSCLRLDGLADLPAAVANEFIHRGNSYELSIAGVKHFNIEDLANLISGLQGIELSLGLVNVTPVIARELARHKGQINLLALETISYESLCELNKYIRQRVGKRETFIDLAKLKTVDEKSKSLLMASRMDAKSPFGFYDENFD